MTAFTAMLSIHLNRSAGRPGSSEKLLSDIEEIRSDKRRSFALFLVFIGFILVFLTLWCMPKESIYDIKMSVIKFTLCLISWTTLFNGFFGLYPHRIKGKSLKIIDLVWTTCGALGVLFALLDSFVQNTEADWVNFDKYSENERKKVVSSLEEVLNTNCPGFRLVTDENIHTTCATILRERNQLQTQKPIDLFPAGERVTTPVDAIDIFEDGTLIVQERLKKIHDADYIVQTRKFYEGTWFSYINSSRKFLSVMFRFLLLMAVSLRLTKSTIEVFWEKSKDEQKPGEKQAAPMTDSP